MMNTVNTEIFSVEVWLTDQASKVLEIKYNVNLTIVIGKNIIRMRYFTEPRCWKYV